MHLVYQQVLYVSLFDQMIWNVIFSRPTSKHGGNQSVAKIQEIQVPRNNTNPPKRRLSADKCPFLLVVVAGVHVLCFSRNWEIERFSDKS